MNSPQIRPFNSVAAVLTAPQRKALMEAMWSGGAQIMDDATKESTFIAPDRAAVDGEHLFYVCFLGSSRDRIPTQHYMMPAPDERTAVTRAHERYVLEPRHRKGASLRVMVGKPPA